MKPLVFSQQLVLLFALAQDSFVAFDPETKVVHVHNEDPHKFNEELEPWRKNHPDTEIAILIPKRDGITQQTEVALRLMFSDTLAHA